MRVLPAMSQPGAASAKGGGCACTSLRKAARAVTQLYDEVLRPSGLRATQLAILAATMGTGRVTVTRLAEVIVTDRTTLTRNLRLLERRRLLRIASGDDRRERTLTVTERGRATLAKAFPLWEQAQGRIKGGLGPERFQALLAELSAVVALA